MSLVRAGVIVRGGLVVGLALAGVCAWGQNPAPKPSGVTLVEPPAPLLPKLFGTWQPTFINTADHDQLAGTLSYSDGFDPATCVLVPPNPVPGPHPVTDAATHCTALLKEDSVQRLASGHYTHQTAGSAAIDLAAFEFVDATAAASAYSYYRSLMHSAKIAGPDSRSSKTAGETSTDADSTLVWMGTAVLKVSGHISPAELKILVDELPKGSGRRAIAPLLPTLLPADVSGIKIDPNSIRYAIGPVGYKAMQGILPAEILGWDKSLEVATANYSGHGAKGTLTLLLYPTPQIAGDRGRAIEKALNDGQPRGTVKLRRIGPLVGMTSGTFTPDQAEKLVQALHLNEEVSFDKKMPLEFHAEIQKTATLLQSIAVFVGIMILASVVVGVFLGGGRALIRKMRGQSAASDPEFLTIDLRGRPAPLQGHTPPPKVDPPADPPASGA